VEDEAFDVFVRTSSKSLLRTAALLAGDAELGRDLLQAALVQALLRWRSIDAPGRLRPPSHGHDGHRLETPPPLRRGAAARP